MSFETTGLPLPTTTLAVCTSYLTPPESRYLAAHQPADHTATALFAQFRAAYESQVMWDYLAPSYGAVAGATSRAGVTAYYERLNGRVLACVNSEVPEAERPLKMPAGDPFLANARLQGLVIRCLIEDCNHRSELVFPEKAFSDVLFHRWDEPVVSMLLHTAFSPMAASTGWEEVPAQDFYGTTLPWHVFHTVQHSHYARELERRVETTIYRHHAMVQRNFNDDFFRACQMQNAVPLFLKHGGKLTFCTLENTVLKLLAYLRTENPDSSVIQNFLNLIQRHMNGNMNISEQEQFSLYYLLNTVLKESSSDIVCNIVMILRNEFILRGLQVDNLDVSYGKQTFDDPYLLACARKHRNQAVINMVQELIRQQSASSERPAAAAGAGAGAAAK